MSAKISNAAPAPTGSVVDTSLAWGNDSGAKAVAVAMTSAPWMTATYSNAGTKSCARGSKGLQLALRQVG